MKIANDKSQDQDQQLVPDELEGLEVDRVVRSQDVEVRQETEIRRRRRRRRRRRLDVDGQRRQRREDQPSLDRRRTVLQVMMSLAGDRDKAVEGVHF